MLRVLRFPKSSVESDVVIADLEVLSGCDDVDFPAYAIDDEPVAYLLSPL